MICKTFVQKEGECIAQVTFPLPDSIWADQIYLVGDFNDWLPRYPFRRTHDGSWSITIDLPINRAFQFRYLRDHQSWLIDRQADDYICDAHGRMNSVIITDPYFRHIVSPYFGRHTLPILTGLYEGSAPSTT
jgi:hypothetical protein